MTNLDDHAELLVEEFEEGESVRQGIARVLTRITETLDSYIDEDESDHVVRISVLQGLIEKLSAPSLLERALAGDRAAAREFLQQLGMIDADGQLVAPYRPEDLKD